MLELPLETSLSIATAFSATMVLLAVMTSIFAPLVLRFLLIKQPGS
jgi:hypothetical protein